MCEITSSPGTTLLSAAAGSAAAVATSGGSAGEQAATGGAARGLAGAPDADACRVGVAGSPSPLDRYASMSGWLGSPELATAVSASA